MIAVIFEAETNPEFKDEYFDLAATLQPLLDKIDGFISIERFESVSTPGKILSVSYWRNERAIETWRNLAMHRKAQAAARSHVFADYRLRVAKVLREYSLTDRQQAPEDSSTTHG